MEYEASNVSAVEEARSIILPRYRGGRMKTSIN
jgi:hypothetical protein